MYSTKEFTRQCIKQGFSLTNQKTLSRWLGDGVLQQIFYGEPDQIWVGLTSMYSDLPDIFWKSNIPFTTYQPKNLHGMPTTNSRVGSLQEDISLLMDGGLAVLDEINTQEKLVKFALKTNDIQGRSPHLHNERFWGAYIVCGLRDELMHEVCYSYTDVCEGFRRKKENVSLIENYQPVKFFENYLLLDKKLERLSELWCALLLNDLGFLEEYTNTNLSRNFEQSRVRKIPILDQASK